MSTNEIVDAVLRLLGILISWPLVVLVVVIIARRQLPALIVDLPRRVRKAPGGFEFDQLKEQMDTVAEKVKHIEEVVTFRPSAALTPDLKQNMQKTLSGYYEYFKTVGFKPDTGRPEVEIRSNFENGNAHYYSSENRIIIDKRMAADPDVALREYTHHVLDSIAPVPSQELGRSYHAIESGLADYFPCSFTDNAMMGEESGRLLNNGKPFRNLENERQFKDAIPDDHRDVGEIWGGAFWEIRNLLQPEVADRLLYSSWQDQTSNDIHRDEPQAFVKQLLAEARHPAHSNEADTIQSIFQHRGLEV
jgi:hypothetical protein